MAEIYRAVDNFVLQGFEALFQRLKDEGRIDPVLEIPALAQVFMTIGDGLFWRRAVDPGFDPAVALPTTLSVLGGLLRPTQNGGGPAHSDNRPHEGER